MLKRFLFLQSISLIGLIIGSLIAPESPIYPFAPSEADMEYVHRVELVIVIIMASFSTVFSLLGSYIFRLSCILALFATLNSGIFTTFVSSLRFGGFSLPPFTLIMGYVLVTCLLTILTHAIKKHNQAST